MLVLVSGIGVTGRCQAEDSQIGSSSSLPDGGSQRLHALLADLREGSERNELTVEKAEEVLSLLDHRPELETRMEVLILLSRNLSSRGDAESGLARAEEAALLAESVGNDVELSRAQYSLALAKWYLARTEEALAHGREALALQDRVGSAADRAKTHTLLGAIHRSRSEYDAALTHHLEARELAAALEDPSGVARSDNNIGLLHWSLENHQQARRHLLLALDHYEREERLGPQASVLGNLGLIEIELGEAQKAIGVLEEALRLHDRIDEPRSRARVLSNLAFAHEQLGDLQGALSFHALALDLKRQANNAWGVARTLGSMARIHLQQGASVAAEKEFIEALALAREADARTEQAALLEDLAILYEETGRFQQALGAAREAQTITLEINREETRLRLAQLEQSRQLALRELELNRQGQRQALLIAGGLLLLLLLVVLALEARSRSVLLRRVRQRNDELAATTLRLRESETHYRQLFDDVVVPRLLIDMQSGEVLELNTPAERLCGPWLAQGSETQGRRRTVGTLQPEWLRSAAQEGGAAEEGPICRHRQWTDGEATRHAQVWLSPTALRGRRCMLLTVHDVTEDRRLEEDRIRMSQLDSLGVLAGGIAHDFNNALMAVLGNISLAKFSVEDGSEADRILMDAEVAVQHAADLTSSLLVFSRGGEPRRQPVDVGATVGEAARFALSGSSVRLTLELEDGLWADADPVQFRQVVSNLVLNGAQAMDGQGRLTVEATRHVTAVPLSSTAGPGEYLRVSVADEGPGVPEEIRLRLYEPYFTTKSSGSGLGLASSFAITARHGGWLRLQDGSGSGATFEAFFPACEAPVPATCVHSGALSRAPGRILVMDDDEAVRAVYRAALARLGYEVVEAEHGEAAVELYREAAAQASPFQLVILDLTVPGGMGGARTLEALRSSDPNVLAIVASGYSNDPVMSGYRQAGFAAALQKPFGLSTLEETLSEVLATASGHSRAG